MIECSNCGWRHVVPCGRDDCPHEAEGATDPAIVKPLDEHQGIGSATEISSLRAQLTASEQALQGMRSALKKIACLDEVSEGESLSSLDEPCSASIARKALLASSGPSPTTTTDDLRRAYQEGREAGLALVREAKAEEAQKGAFLAGWAAHRDQQTESGDSEDEDQAWEIFTTSRQTR
jgi:hypothetical protein